ncbi:hypothetical protein [Hutsoniella sourekii]|uniref:hypothetical protein n=1 Tax=Hutsoniella sourekii TaxID=87650 RepID=UPI00389937E5
MDNHLGDLASEVKLDEDFPKTISPAKVRQYFEQRLDSLDKRWPTIDIALGLYRNQFGE